MAYRLQYSDYPGTASGPPDPERWVGPQGPVGPQGATGPQGPQGQPQTGGPFLPLSGGTVTGPLNVTATGSTATRSVQDRFAGEINVKDYGALGIDGSQNATAAFNAAIAAASATNKKVVRVPSGFYNLDPITIPEGVTLAGDIPGPIDPRPGFLTNALGATLFVNSHATPFITLQSSACLQDVMIYDPGQVAPTAAAPNVYPAQVLMSGSSRVRRITLCNAYVGISVQVGRCIVTDCYIGAYKTAVTVDQSQDVTYFNNIWCGPFYDSCVGLFPWQAMDTWVMNNNGVGFSFGRADAVSMVNCGAFLKWASIYIQDGTGGASYGWSVNHNADACIYGVVAYSTNDPGWQFTNMQVLPTQGSGVQAVAPVYLPSGGTNQQPVITWTAGTNGGFPSYWTYPNGLVNRGSLKVRGVNNIADTGLLPLAGGTLTGVLTLNAGTADPPLRTQTGSQIWASGVRSADGYYTIRDQSGSLTVLTVVPSGGGGVVQVATPMALSNGANFGAQTGASNTDLSKHLALHTAGYGLSVTANRLNYTAAGAAAHVFLSNGADVMAVSNTAASVVVPFQFVSKVGFNNTVPITKPTGWGAPTGTATRTTFATSTVLLPALAEHVKALIDDLTAYGLIGP